VLFALCDLLSAHIVQSYGCVYLCLSKLDDDDDGDDDDDDEVSGCCCTLLNPHYYCQC